MKLQIDTNAKTIKVEGLVNFNDLIKTVQNLLPLEWQNYSIESGSVIYWPSYPVIIYDPIYPQPLMPYYGTTCGTTYNVEVN